MLMGYAVGDSLLAGELCRGGAWDPRGDGVAQEDGYGLHEREGHGPEGVLRGHGYALLPSDATTPVFTDILSAGLDDVVRLDAQAGGKAFEVV